MANVNTAVAAAAKPTAAQLRSATGVFNAMVSKTFGANGIGESIAKMLTSGKPADATKLAGDIVKHLGDLLAEQIDKHEAAAKTATAGAGNTEGMRIARECHAAFASATVPKFVATAAMHAYRYCCWAFYDSLEKAGNKDAIVNALATGDRRALRTQLAKLGKKLGEFMTTSPWIPDREDKRPAKKATGKAPAKAAPKAAPAKGGRTRKPAAGKTRSSGTLSSL